MPAPGFPCFKGLKPFGGSWGLLGASWGLSWPFRGKMKGCTKNSIVLKNRIFHCGHGQILGPPPLEGLLKPFGGSWCLLGALWGKWRGAQNHRFQYLKIAWANPGVPPPLFLGAFAFWSLVP